MIVVDASALLEVLLRTPAANAVEDRLFAPGQTLHAPHLLDVEVAQVVATTPVEVAATEPEPVVVADNTLPGTSSVFPLIGLCGLLALGGAFTLRSISKRA